MAKTEIRCIDDITDDTSRDDIMEFCGGLSIENDKLHRKIENLNEQLEISKDKIHDLECKNKYTDIVEELAKQNTIDRIEELEKEKRK